MNSHSHRLSILKLPPQWVIASMTPLCLCKVGLQEVCRPSVTLSIAFNALLKWTSGLQKSLLTCFPKRGEPSTSRRQAQIWRKYHSLRTSEAFLCVCGKHFCSKLAVLQSHQFSYNLLVIPCLGNWSKQSIVQTLQQ